MAKSFDENDLKEFLGAAEAAEALAKNAKLFQEAVEAHRARDAGRFQAALDQAGLSEHCHHICRFICDKHCVSLCLRFCPDKPAHPVDIKEMRAFAQALAKLVRDEAAFKRLLEIMEAEDVNAWQAELKRLNLSAFCHQLCHFLCSWRCKLVCRDLCPPKPLITRVGSIPISQIDAQGFGHGTSIPPFQVPAPNPAAGVGDHPFGGSAELRGVFNMPSATEYLVEVATNPAGPYTPITVPVQGYNYISVFPFISPVTRFPSGGIDPGWFKVLDIPDSDGGPTALFEKRLMDWPTPIDGIYYLRLRVRDGVNTRISSPQVVQTDNTAPPQPTIKLQLQKPDGTRPDLKCGKVKRGDGVIVVSIKAFDKNFSALSVAAQGNSGLSVPVVDTASVPLSKTYNGNTADQGYPVLTEFLWDPWSDPRMVPCCYVVRIDITDRAVINNSWAGGHGNAGWEAIEIGF